MKEMKKEKISPGNIGSSDISLHIVRYFDEQDFINEYYKYALVLHVSAAIR